MTATERSWQGIRWVVDRRVLITADNADRMVPIPWIWPRSTDGSPVVWLTGKSEHVRDLLRTLGGLFSQQEENPVRDYDLAEPNSIDQIFTSVCKVDPRDPEAVTRLINEWGQLGVGMASRFNPSDEPLALFGGCDSLRATVNELEIYQQHVRWLEALQGRDAIALRKAGVSDASSRVIDRKEKWSQRWLDFAKSLEQHVSAVHPGIRWDREMEAARPAWMLRCPRDVLWATLWDWATQGGRLRRCENRTCRSFFVATDPRRQSCSRTCSKRKAASDWYWKRGGRDRRKSRRTTRTRRRSRR